MRISTTELGRLLEITTQTTRVTAEIPAVDLDLILSGERVPDLGDLLQEELEACVAEIHDLPLAWTDESKHRRKLNMLFPAVGAF